MTDNIIGQVIKGYELRELIGEGGFGRVYRANQTRLNREVAIKIILPVYASHPDFIRRFETEARLVARLEHLHIVPLYDYWRDPNGAFLVTRLLRGGNLHDLAKSKKLTIGAITRIIDQIASALMVAHQNNVVHRDIKPANILMDNNGNAYLTDFGIAKVRDSEVVAEITPADTLIGSPAYSCPEHIQGKEMTFASDIYALGIIAYELLTGRHPFPHTSISQLLLKHIEDFMPLVSEELGLPAGFDHVLQRATAKKPEDRYQDIATFAAAFRKAANLADNIEAKILSTDASVEISTPLGTSVVPENPYKGLRSFEEADEEDFFGREVLVKTLLERMTEKTPMSRFLALVGPSGSGKSSAIKAGLIPALRRGALPGSKNWFIIEMQPGPYLMEELEAVLLSVAINPIPDLVDILQKDDRGLLRAIKRVLPYHDQNELVLFIDQFEQIFTQVIDELLRTLFLENLVTAVMIIHSRLRVITTLRADFYDRPLLYARFGDLIRQRDEVILPLNPRELEQAIIAPARKAGLSVDASLVAAIVADIKEQPGALPLLQYALTELFNHRSNRYLTLASYQEIGGAMGALASSAEDLYAQLDIENQTLTRQIFLRLIAMSEEIEDTGRRVLLSELLTLSPYPERVEHILNVFGQNRLLSFDRDAVSREPVVEIAHDALIRPWERLRQWLDVGREDLLFERRLAYAAAEWLNSGKDSSFLLSGARLTQVALWNEHTELALVENERAFLEASLAERAAQQRLEQERQQRERFLETRARQRLQMLTGVLLAATIIALFLSAITFNQRQVASEERDRANSALLTSEANAALALENEALAQTQVSNAATSAAVAENARLEAEASESITGSVALAITSQSALTRNLYDLALRLAREANQIDNPPIQAQRVLYATAYLPGTRFRFLGHEAPVYDVAFVGDGQQALSSSGDGSLILWNLETRQSILKMEEHQAAIWSFALAGQTLLSASDDMNLILWDIDTASPLATLQGHTDSVRAIGLSADGKIAFSGSNNGELIIWDIENRQERLRLAQQNSAIRAIAVSQDGQQGLSGADDGSLILWNLQDGTEIRRYTGHTDAIRSIAISPDEKAMLSGSADQSLMLWNMDTGLRVRRFTDHSGRVLSVAFSPDGRTIASGATDNVIYLWSRSTGQRIQEFQGHERGVTKVVFSSDGQSLLSASLDGTLRWWDITGQEQQYSLQGHSGFVNAVAYSPDGQTIASGSSDTSIILWNLQTGVEIKRLQGHTNVVTDIAFSPDGQQLISGSFDRSMRLWDINTGTEIRRFEEHSSWVTDVAFSPDGQTILSGSEDNSLILWNLDSGEIIFRLNGHEATLTDITYDLSGQKALTSSADNTTILWDLNTGHEIQRFTGGTSSFSPDGQTIAMSLPDNSLVLINLETGEELQRFTGHADLVHQMVFAPDNKSLLSGSADDSVILWDIASGQEIYRFMGHSDDVFSVAISPDGNTALSGGDTRVIVWRAPTLATLKAWILDNRYIYEFSCEERAEYRVLPLCDEESTTPADNQG